MTRRRTRYAATGNGLTLRAMADSVSRLTAIVERLLGREAAAEALTPRVNATLTARELEIARLIVEGLSTRQIADRLTLEPATVKTHRRGISRKVGASSREGLTAKRETWERGGD
jgi:DNA-binding NarL/FixJ family response regulator